MADSKKLEKDARGVDNSVSIYIQNILEKW
jgi:hypothetical protein